MSDQDRTIPEAEFCTCGHPVAYHRYNGCHPLATRDCPCVLAPIDFAARRTIPERALVRVWNGFQEEIAAGFVVWEGRGFVLPTKDDPLAKLLFESAHLGNLRLTVYSTEELLWNVKQVDVSHGEATVHCAPFIDQLRDSLFSDDYMVWLWLEAEKRWADDDEQRLGWRTV